MTVTYLQCSPYRHDIHRWLPGELGKGISKNTWLVYNAVAIQDNFHINWQHYMLTNIAQNVQKMAGVKERMVCLAYISPS